MHTEYLFENLKERDYLEESGIDERTVFEIYLKGTVYEVQTRCVGLRIVVSGWTVMKLCVL
jgi:hypothetical protein